MDLINKLNKTKNVWAIIPTLSQKDLETILTLASDSYYNTSEELISDSLYDILIERLKIVHPSSDVLKNIGAGVKSGNKVKLPYWMGSMDKIKGDQKALDSWVDIHSGPYVGSNKVDGISVLYVNTDGVEKLYTRGNGREGRDVSHLLEHCNMSMDMVPDNVVIRGEMIMTKHNFTKYKHLFKNPRAMVAGVINSKQDKINKSYASKIDFIAFELIKPRFKQSKQFSVMENLGLKVVKHYDIESVDVDYLTEIFNEEKENFEYEVDGIIITDDKKQDIVTHGNPSYSFAFKGATPTMKTKVIEVIWTPSKDGILVPRVHYEKVKLSGVEMEYATGFNAQFIYNNGIGKGAMITVIRSGDVIPYIINVDKQAKEIGLPENYEYTWDKNEVNIVIDDPDDIDVKVKLITKFFKDIDAKYISEGIVLKLIENGYTDVFSILKMSVENFMELEGFKEKLATKIYNSIQSKINNIDVLNLMIASNAMGRGFAEKKLKKIFEEYPDIIYEYDENDYEYWKESIVSIEGYDDITATQFLDKLPEFIDYYNEMQKIVNVKPYHSTIDKNGIWKNQTVVFTGFKNPEWKKIIENNGGKVSESVSKNTTLVVYKDGQTNTSKYMKAVALGIKIITKTEFEKEMIVI